jgi:hypothetical protein
MDVATKEDFLTALTDARKSICTWHRVYLLQCAIGRFLVIVPTGC